MRMGAIFQERDLILLADLHNRVHLSRDAPHMCHDNSASTCCHMALNFVRIDIATSITVAEDWYSSCMHKWGYCGEKRISWHNHLIARTQVQALIHRVDRTCPSILQQRIGPT